MIQQNSPLDLLSAEEKRALLRQLLRTPGDATAHEPPLSTQPSATRADAEPVHSDAKRSDADQSEAHRTESHRTEVAESAPRRRWRLWPLRRADGDLVEGLTPLRAIMPFIMKRRSDCLAYQETNYDVTHASDWLRTYNQSRPAYTATFFDLFLWALHFTVNARPEMNRFVSGRRLYQRRGVYVSFAAKKAYRLDAPMITNKLALNSPNESFASLVERINDTVNRGREGPPQKLDRELALITKLPAWMLRLGVKLFLMLDWLNLLPWSFTEHDPMYTTAFVANLGSLGLDSSFHHLYEFGTCSLFATLGAQKKMLFVRGDGEIEAKDGVQVRWTVDTRIADGFYNASCLRLVQSIVEDPQAYLGCPRRAARGETTVQTSPVQAEL